MNYVIIVFYLGYCSQLIFAQPSPYSFKNQFIGNYSNYVTAEEEQKRNFCTNYWCINDAHYLFTKSSQYPNVDPCVDFKNFTVNQVDEVDHPDDRLVARGFISIIEAKYNERIRKVVAAKFDPIKDENSRVIKIVKNSFRQCLKSKHALRHIQAHKDIVEHLQSLGGSPYLSKHIHFNRDKFNEATDYGIDDLWTNNVPNSFNEDELWTGKDFNVRKYFETEPSHAIDIFFNLKVGRCKNDEICLRIINNFGFIENEEFDFENIKELLRTLDDAFRMRPQLRKILVEQVYRPTFRRYRKFFKKRDETFQQFKNSEATKIKIKNLQMINSEQLKIDWLQIINSELFVESKLTENDEIWIEGGTHLLQQLVNNLIKTDKKTIADTFDITFIYIQRFRIILHFHNNQEMFQEGYKHGKQRWDSCIFKFSFQQHMQPALLVMYEQYRSVWDRTLGDFDRNLVDERIDIVGNAEKLIYEAIEEFKRRFLIESASKMPVGVAADILLKLKNLKVLIGLPKSIFPISKLEEFYNELNLTGNENYLKSFWEIRHHYSKLINEPKNSWRRQIDQVISITGHLVKYNIDDGNILYISPFLIIYPIYHPLRPRFFNMATLFKETFSVNSAIEEYIWKKYNIKVDLPAKNHEQVTYEHYKNWLKTNKDLQIGANYLTNEQLYWVALAVTEYVKFHNRTVNFFDEHIRPYFDYLHIRYKSMKGFQEAFQCNITENEKKLSSEVKQKLELANRILH